MVLDLGSKRSASNGILNRNSSGFVPAKAPATGTVKVVLLQRKSTGDNGESDPRQRTPGRNGGMDTVRNQVLLDLVCVYLNKLDAEGNNVLDKDGNEVLECFPDFTGKNPLPRIGTPEFKHLMTRPIGIFVDAMFADQIEELRNAILDGAPLPFSVEDLDEAVRNNTLNQLLTTDGATLRALGLMPRQEWTLGDILFGSKTLSVQMLADGEGDAYATSFTELRGTLGFPNVAFIANIGNTLVGTELTPNGVLTPTYTPDGVYLDWVEVPGPQGRRDYKLNPAGAISGAKFAVGVTTAANASELARRGVGSQHQGQVQSTSYRTNLRDANKVRGLRDALGGGQRGPNAVPAGGYDDSGL